MPTDFIGTLVLVLSCVATFTTARILSRHWRKRRRDREEAARRAGESRQVRRARSRKSRA